MMWMRDKGIRFMPDFGRQAYKVDGRFKFWGGATVAVASGGPGLVDGAVQGRRKAGRRRSATRPGCAHSSHDDDGVHGVRDHDRGLDARLPARALSSSHAAGSRPTPRCAPATSGRAGIWRRCAAADTTPATASRWRWSSARSPTGTGRAATPSRGSERLRLRRPRRHAAVPAPQLPVRGSWSTPTASVSSTKARTSATTPTPSTGAPSSSSPVRSPGRSSTARSNTCCVTNTAPGRSPRSGPTRSRSWPTSSTRSTAPSSCETIARVQRRGARRPCPSIRTSRTDAAHDGLEVPRSNWAIKIDTPPFSAYGVTCGITFTFGGVKIDNRGQVVDVNEHADSRPVRRGRDGRRHLLPQLPGRKRA